MGVDVAYGSQPEVPPSAQHICSTPDSRHRYADRSRSTLELTENALRCERAKLIEAE
jgi:hypothetical protein